MDQLNEFTQPAGCIRQTMYSPLSKTMCQVEKKKGAGDKEGQREKKQSNNAMGKAAIGAVLLPES